MAIQNVIGDSFRGATWVSIHNGGGKQIRIQKIKNKSKNYL